ncbi:Crp/Fnr family transcriptional regulator [Algoriphagus boseongensis]|uniref:Crp/Fnr family transcriptional regulator n=1 Tax=Algoriphagus boseongensis TaxID=1442587 RepID=UPI00105D6151|nr:Crp/Fnr family transcriptional regulator [Algoriphagus boseongensis]
MLYLIFIIKMEVYVKQLKRDFNHLMLLSDDFYGSLSRYLFLKRKKKGEVIKALGQKGSYSRYLCKGLIGVYKIEKETEYLLYVFKETDLIHDWISYACCKKSSIEIKAISEVLYLEFSLLDLKCMLAKHPEIIHLLLLLNHRIQVRIYQQVDILRKGIKEGLPFFCKAYSGIELHLSYQDWASLFSSSIRTVGRVLSKHTLGYRIPKEIPEQETLIF